MRSPWLSPLLLLAGLLPLQRAWVSRWHHGTCPLKWLGEGRLLTTLTIPYHPYMPCYKIKTQGVALVLLALEVHEALWSNCVSANNQKLCRYVWKYMNMIEYMNMCFCACFFFQIYFGSCFLTCSHLHHDDLVVSGGISSAVSAVPVPRTHRAVRGGQWGGHGGSDSMLVARKTGDGFCRILRGIITHRIHGTGIFTYMNGLNLSWMDGVGVEIWDHCPPWN